MPEKIILFTDRDLRLSSEEKRAFSSIGHGSDWNRKGRGNYAYDRFQIHARVNT